MRTFLFSSLASLVDLNTENKHAARRSDFSFMDRPDELEFAQNYLQHSTFGYYYSMVTLSTMDRLKLLR